MDIIKSNRKQSLEGPSSCSYELLDVRFPTMSDSIDSSHHTVLFIGFEETLVYVDENDWQVPLNVSILINDIIDFPYFEFFDPYERGITFSLFANTVNDSAGMSDAPQFSQPYFIIILFHV